MSKSRAYEDYFNQSYKERNSTKSNRSSNTSTKSTKTNKTSSGSSRRSYEQYFNQSYKERNNTDNGWGSYEDYYNGSYKKQKTSYDAWDNYKYFTYKDKNGLTQYEKEKILKEKEKQEKARLYSNPTNPYNRGQIWNAPINQENGYQYDPLYYTHNDIERLTQGIQQAGQPIPKPELLEKEKTHTWNPLKIFGNLVSGASYGLANAGKTLTDKNTEGFKGELKTAGRGLLKGLETSLHASNITPEYEKYRGSFTDMFENLNKQEYDVAKKTGYYFVDGKPVEFTEQTGKQILAKNQKKAGVLGFATDVFADPLAPVSGVVKSSKLLTKGSSAVRSVNNAEDVLKATGKTVDDLASMEFNGIRKLNRNAKTSKDVSSYVEYYKQAKRLINQSPKAKVLSDAEKVKEAEYLVNRSLKKAGYFDSSGLKYGNVNLIKGETLVDIGDKLVNFKSNSKTLTKASDKVSDMKNKPFELVNNYFGGDNNLFNIPLRQAKQEKNVLELMRIQNLKDTKKFAKNVQKKANNDAIDKGTKWNKVFKKKGIDSEQTIDAMEDSSDLTENITNTYSKVESNPDYVKYENKSIVELQEDYKKLEAERNVAERTLREIEDQFDYLRTSDDFDDRLKAQYADKVLNSQKEVARLKNEQKFINDLAEEATQYDAVRSVNKEGVIEDVGDTLKDSELKLNKEQLKNVKNITKETSKENLIKKRGDSTVAFSKEPPVKTKNIDNSKSVSDVIKKNTTPKDITKGDFDTEKTIQNIKEGHRLDSIKKHGYDVTDKKVALKHLEEKSMNREVEEQAIKTLNNFKNKYGKDEVIKRMGGRYPAVSMMSKDEQLKVIKKLTTGTDRKEALTKWYTEATQRVKSKAKIRLDKDNLTVKNETNRHFYNIIQKKYKEASKIDKMNILDAFNIDDIGELGFSKQIEGMYLDNYDFEKAYRTYANKTRINKNQAELIGKKYNTPESSMKALEQFKETKKTELAEQIRKEMVKTDPNARTLTEQLQAYVKEKGIQSANYFTKEDLDNITKIKEDFKTIGKDINSQIDKKVNRKIANLLNADTMYDLPKEHFNDFLKMADNDNRLVTKLESKTLMDLVEEVSGLPGLKRLKDRIKGIELEKGTGINKGQYDELIKEYRAMKTSVSKIYTRDYTSDAFTSLSKEEQMDLLKQDQFHDAKLTGDISPVTGEKVIDYTEEKFIKKSIDEQLEQIYNDNKTDEKHFEYTNGTHDWEERTTKALKDFDLKVKEKALTGKEANRANKLFVKNDNLSDSIKEVNDQIAKLNGNKVLPKTTTLDNLSVELSHDISYKVKKLEDKRQNLVVQKAVIQREYELLAKLDNVKLSPDLSELRKVTKGYMDYVNSYRKIQAGDTSKALKDIMKKNKGSFDTYKEKHKLYNDMIKYQQNKSSLGRYFDGNKLKENFKESLHVIFNTKNYPDANETVSRVVNALENPTTAYDLKKANQIAEFYATTKQTYALSNDIDKYIKQIPDSDLQKRVLSEYNKFKLKLDKGKLIPKNQASNIISTAYSDPSALSFKDAFKNSTKVFDDFINEDYFAGSFKLRSSDISDTIETLQKNIGQIKYEYQKAEDLNFMKVELSRVGTNVYVEASDDSVGAAKKIMSLFDNNNVIKANKTFLKDMDIYILDTNKRVPTEVLGAYKKGKAVIFDIHGNPAYTFMHESGHNATKKLKDIFGAKTKFEIDLVIKNFTKDSNNLKSEDFADLYDSLYKSDMLTSDYKSSLDLEELFKEGFPSKYAKNSKEQGESFAEIIAMTQSDPKVSSFFRTKMPNTYAKINELLTTMNDAQIEKFTKAIYPPFIQSNANEIKHYNKLINEQLKAMQDYQLAATLSNAGIQRKVIKNTEQKMADIKRILQDPKEMEKYVIQQNHQFGNVSKENLKRVNATVKDENKIREYLTKKYKGKAKNKNDLSKIEDRVETSVQFMKEFREDMEKVGFEEGILKDAENLEKEEILSFYQRYVPHQITDQYKKDIRNATILDQMELNKSTTKVNQAKKTRKIKDTILEKNSKVSEFFETHLPKIYVDRMIQHNSTMYAETFENEFFTNFGYNIKDAVDKDTIDNMLDDGYILVRKGKTGEYKRGMLLDELRFGTPTEAKDTILNYASTLTPNKNFQPVDLKGLDVKKYLELDQDNIFLVKNSMYDIYDKEMLKQFTKDKETFGKYFFKVYDQITNKVFKPLATVVNPTFHMTNMLGNTFQQYLAAGAAALNPKHNYEATIIMMGGKLDKGRKIAGRSIDEISEALTKYGILDTDYFSADMVTNLSPNFKKSKNFSNMDLTNLPGVSQMKDMGSFIESQAKVNLFLTELNAGKSFQEATDTVNKYLFDYSDLTDFEKNVMKRVIPFYTFMRKNIPLQLQSMFENPNRLSRYYRAKRGIGSKDETKDQKLYKPDYLEDATYLGNDTYVNIRTPADDINKMSPKEIYSMLNPLIKLSVEIPTNKNPYFDSDIVPYEGYESKAPMYLYPFAKDTPNGKYMNPKLRYAARNLMPGMESWSNISQGALSKVGMAPELTENEEKKTTGYLSGAKQYTFGKEDINQIKQQMMYDYIDRLQGNVNSAKKKGYIK